MSRTDTLDAGLLDFKFINRIPIVDVARKIGIQVTDDSKITCWRAVEHERGRSAFVRVLKSNKVVCDACDTYPMSVLEMVQDCGFDSLTEAAECVAAFYEVPRKPRGSHLNNPLAETVAPACEDPLALLVKSGVWSNLTVPTQRLIPVLLTFAQLEIGSADHLVLQLSYGAMKTYSGIGGDNSVSKALKELVKIGWIERLEPRARGNSPIEATAQYRLTPLSANVRGLANATAPGFGDAIRKQKAVRKRQRQERERELRRK